MEIPRYWRNQPKFKQFTGFSRINGNGVEFSLNGRHWTPSPNGHHEIEHLSRTKKSIKRKVNPEEMGINLLKAVSK